MARVTGCFTKSDDVTQLSKRWREEYNQKKKKRDGKKKKVQPVVLTAPHNGTGTLDLKQHGVRITRKIMTSVATGSYRAVFQRNVCRYIYNMTKRFIQSKHNTYIVINTQMATCFDSSEPSSGQYLTYGHGAFSECAHYWIPHCLQTIFILKFKFKFYWPIYL